MAFRRAQCPAALLIGAENAHVTSTNHPKKHQPANQRFSDIWVRTSLVVGAFLLAVWTLVRTLAIWTAAIIVVIEVQGIGISLPPIGMPGVTLTGIAGRHI